MKMIIALLVMLPTVSFAKSHDSIQNDYNAAIAQQEKARQEQVVDEILKTQGIDASAGKIQMNANSHEDSTPNMETGNCSPVTLWCDPTTVVDSFDVYFENASTVCSFKVNGSVTKLLDGTSVSCIAR